MVSISSNTTDVAPPRRLTMIGLATWFIAAVVAGRAGIFEGSDRPPLELLGFVVLPIASFATAYLASGAFRTFTHSLSLTHDRRPFFRVDAIARALSRLDGGAPMRV